VRVPNHSFCLELIRKLKAPLVGTSANISGQPSARSTSEVAAYFGKRLRLIIDAGACPTTARESTVVAVEDRNVILIREGPISDELILLAKG
jgi:L-threonylcarbamoyladenylate synthase